MRGAALSAWISALCVLTSGCEDSQKVIDPFPIEVDLSAGPTLLAATTGDESAVAITLDVLSPITVLDSYRAGGEVGKAQRRLVNLTLLGLDGDGNATVPRVLFPDTAAYDLHPCAREGLPPSVCRVGLGDSPREIYGVLGADILARSSIRFDFPSSILRFFPDAAGSASERTLACDAVFEKPYGGGGTLLIGGGEVRYGANRPTLGTCMHTSVIEAPASEESEVGTDMHLAISTAQGPTLLSRSAYTRYAASGAAPPLEDLSATTLHLMSGPVPALLGEVAYMAIVGEVGGDSDRRGPCRELYANTRMRTERTCSEEIVDCPCPDGEDSCKAGAAIEITRTVEVVIVDDALPLLQALRDELRPGVPEVDGIIGVEALSALRVEFDFPNNRLLMRCLDTENCFTRQQVRSPNTLLILDKCRAAEDAERAAPGPDAGPVP